jgi:hypothetical protein
MVSTTRMDTRLKLRAKSLARAHDLRALDAGGGLDFVARNHRARLRQHHRTSTPKVLELFLDHAAGHFQRLGGDGFLAQERAIEQINLRQLAVGHFGEQGFWRSLATRSLLGTSTSTGSICTGTGLG